MALLALHIAALATSTVAGVIDLRSGRIPNWVTLPVAGAGLLAHLGLRGAWGLTESVAGLLLCGGVPLLMFRVSRGRAIGGGDVKLFGALGALLGPRMGLVTPRNCSGRRNRGTKWHARRKTRHQ